MPEAIEERSRKAFGLLRQVREIVRSGCHYDTLYVVELLSGYRIEFKNVGALEHKRARVFVDNKRKLATICFRHVTKATTTEELDQLHAVIGEEFGHVVLEHEPVSSVVRAVQDIRTHDNTSGVFSETDEQEAKIFSIGLFFSHVVRTRARYHKQKYTAKDFCELFDAEPILPPDQVERLWSHMHDSDFPEA